MITEHPTSCDTGFSSLYSILKTFISPISFLFLFIFFVNSSFTLFIIVLFNLFCAFFHEFDLLFFSFCFHFRKKKNILVQAGFKLTVCLPCRVYHCVYTSTKEKIQLYTSDIQSLHSGSSLRWLHRQGWTSNVM
jgi:hypothetical protein